MTEHHGNCPDHPHHTVCFAAHQRHPVRRCHNHTAPAPYGSPSSGRFYPSQNRGILRQRPFRRLGLPCTLFLLCRALWTLAVNAVLKTSCPQRITFAGNMLQIDQTMYSVNRIQQIIMNSPAGKLPLFGHYQITLVTMDGRKRYWLGNAAGLRHDTWRTLCGKMQNLLVSCPARLTYR